MKRSKRTEGLIKVWMAQAQRHLDAGRIRSAVRALERIELIKAGLI